MQFTVAQTQTVAQGATFTSATRTPKRTTRKMSVRTLATRAGTVRIFRILKNASREPQGAAVAGAANTVDIQYFDEAFSFQADYVEGGVGEATLNYIHSIETEVP